MSSIEYFWISIKLLNNFGEMSGRVLEVYPKHIFKPEGNKMHKY